MPTENETAQATQPTSEAKPSTEAPATTLATAGGEAGKQTQPTETQKPQATEKPAEGSEKPAESKPDGQQQQQQPAAGAPEKYEDFKAPEGMQFDTDVITSFSTAAKKANLSQDAAQTLLAEMAPALAQRQLEQVKAIHTEWTEQSKSDKEFGGEKLKENLATAKKALDAFDPIPEGAKTTTLRKLLDTTGLGNHPEVLRLLFRAGKAVSEDGFVGGRPPATEKPKDPASVLYDKSPKKG